LPSPRTGETIGARAPAGLPGVAPAAHRVHWRKGGREGRSEEKTMPRTDVSRPATLGLASWLLGALAFAFYWWVPLGIIWGMLGLVTAFIGGVRQPRGAGVALVVGALVFCAGALAFDLTVAVRGWDTVRIHALR